MSRIGIVAIGRNEGERLKRSLASVLGRGGPVVYVDSGSTDGSAAMARGMGATVVDLDMSIPFTAARARNEGFAKLLSADPQIEFVQFVDGDCEFAAGWLERAADELSKDEKTAVVCGRRREHYPQASIYNKLCDIEWNTPIGQAQSCGGDAMMRVSAFREVGGFDATVIAGEEPELCVRLREAGWKIMRIDAEMTLHDAALTRFGQWWKRNVRAGHAYAQGAHMHAGHWTREVRSNWIWGLALPLLALVAAIPTYGGGLVLLVAYAVLWWRVYRSALRKPLSAKDARDYATFIVIGKIPQALGQLKFHISRLLGRKSRIIEYKSSPAIAA